MNVLLGLDAWLYAHITSALWAQQAVDGFEHERLQVVLLLSLNIGLREVCIRNWRCNYFVWCCT
jgi:hypothetical protein